MSDEVSCLNNPYCASLVVDAVVELLDKIADSVQYWQSDLAAEHFHMNVEIGTANLRENKNKITTRIFKNIYISSLHGKPYIFVDFGAGVAE